MQTAAGPSPAYHELPITAFLESKWNPRKHYDQRKLDELTASIREQGIIEPLVVRPRGPHDGTGGQVEIVAGSRRYRAALAAGLETLPAIVRHMDDVAALELAVVENGQREDVHPLDEAEGYEALRKADKKNYTVAHIAAKVGKDESYIYRRLKLLTLEKDLQQALAEDRLSVGHAERLLRLRPALRTIAAHPMNGVVWSHSPLLDYSEKWIPGKEDLRPLADLEHFIRNKSTFDPQSDDAKHFQPELAQAIEDKIDEQFTDTTDTEEAVEAARSSMVLLSDDPMARMRLGAKQTDRIPLTPSKWREIKKPGDRCAFATQGVIVHGGPARVLEVCTKKSCQKHFPVAKRTTPKRPPQSTPSAPREDNWAREQRLRKGRAQLWARVWPDVKRALVAHLKPVTLTANLIRSVVREGEIYSHAIDQVEEDFGVELTDRTIALVFALTCFTEWDERDRRKHAAGVFKFNLAPFDKQLKASVDADKKAATAKVKAAKAKPATGKKAKKGKA